MGKGRPRAVEKGVLKQNFSVGEDAAASSSGCGIIPPAPVYYPSEEEFEDPLEFISKIRAEAELYGICRIVPPEGWKPPFAIDSESFTFPTKTQAIHQLQARPASCDSKTFELEYARFLKEHCGRKVRKRVVFEDGDLDLCRLFNAVRRYGGYDKVVKGKKWGEVFRFVRSKGKLSECAKHVLCQLYREHLYDYEVYYSRLNKEKGKSCKRRNRGEGKGTHTLEVSNSKKKRKGNGGRKIDCEMEEEEEGEPDQICEQCKSGLHGEVMLLCDRCNKGWHIHCLSPPLEQVPPGNWYCFDCLNSDKDSFGFVPGKNLSLEAFRRVADRAKKKWFGAGSISKMQLEKKFWEIVEGSTGEVEVLYGSDLDTSVYGSGFPRFNDHRPASVECNAWDKYCASAWNLNNLPKLKGSMLKAVHQNIAGVMVPWLYVGMLFSSFCWHFEDHCFYSMNYLHWGEPKCWYSVPGSAAESFEKVMRKSLPDLFDAQPDLLFQLVTMLNPSVLQANGVPVYNVVQEPGNFIITFPRSFHAGFNFGLNCAEAVNFAPADWIPHGGFSADLYRLYRKPAVLSHEELICVVAESNCEGYVSPFLKKELLRLYNKEKTWRERLWKKGMVKSSLMSPRKCPEFVGTEEDPTCIICQQYLYLSAVVCQCRPSAFVCLEHWEHFCECKPSKHRLMYRHTLADLEKLVSAVDKRTCSESRNALPETFSASNPSALTKKVKDGHATMAQLVEKWLLRSSSILQNPYSKDAYSSALKEAEEFLWAGTEMDPVRDMVKKLVEACNWAEDVRNFLFKIEKRTSSRTCDSDVVDLESVDKLLSFDLAPCNEPGHLKLKDYAEEAKKLIQEIGSMLSSSPKISDLEELYSRSCHLRFSFRENEMLAKKLSSAKDCMERVKACVCESRAAAIEIDLLYKLKAELFELQVLIPESQKFLELLHKTESYRAECTENLKGPMIFKDIELIVKKMEGFSVNIPELMLLRQHYTDAASWISRFIEIRKNIHERVDQDNVIVELNSILKDRGSLKIQVEELPLVELELRKAYCRGKGLKARGNKMTLDFLKQLWAEAVELQIEEENIFVYISEVIKAAICWEEGAAHIIKTRAHISKFEEMMRASGDIDAVLPSISDIMDAIEAAKCWLKNSLPFLEPSCCILPNSSPRVETLKELVSQSKLLKISLEEQTKLESVLEQCDHWLQEAASVLQDAKEILNVSNVADGLNKGLDVKIGCLLRSVDAVLTSGLSTGIGFSDVPKLKDTYAMLQWCNGALSLSSVMPLLEEVDRLLEFERQIPVAHVSCTLCSVLIDGLKCVKKALEIVAPNGHERCSLSIAEEVFAGCQSACFSIPLLTCQLEKALQRHRLWQRQVCQYFHLKSSQRSWSQLLQLKEMGENAAFICPELDMVLSEVEKIEKWKQQLKDITGTLLGDADSHGQAIEKIRNSLNRSLIAYGNSKASRMHGLCMCCFEGLEYSKFISCKTCEDCYHVQCVGLALDNKRLSKVFRCSFCKFLKRGFVPRTSMDSRRDGRKLELSILVKLLSEMKDLCIQMEEREPLEEILKCAHSCKAHLKDILDFVSAYPGENLGAISRKLAVAWKATRVASVRDHEDTNKLELAVTRHSWRVRVSRLFKGSRKPTIPEIRQMLKEGLEISIPQEDHFRCKLAEIRRIALKWIKTAKEVVADGGALSLDKVFELINEGENLPVCIANELMADRLRSRSRLHCICRKPFDERPMFPCYQCHEWYHYDCMKLNFPTPMKYLCPVCKPCVEDDSMPKLDPKISTVIELLEPRTPSPKHGLLRINRDNQSIRAEKASLSGNHSKTFSPSGIDSLWWRNRKPFRRLARKRAELDSLSFCHLSQCN